MNKYIHLMLILITGSTVYAGDPPTLQDFREHYVRSKKPLFIELFFKNGDKQATVSMQGIEGKIKLPSALVLKNLQILTDPNFTD